MSIEWKQNLSEADQREEINQAMRDHGLTRNKVIMRSEYTSLYNYLEGRDAPYGKICDIKKAIDSLIAEKTDEKT